MPITRKTPAGQIKRSIERRTDQLVRRLIMALARAGEEGLTFARDPTRKRYTDRTGNLTSSIGYCVLYDGQPLLISDFRPVSPGKDPKTGKQYKGGNKGGTIGRNLLSKLISENSQGLVLIMVAGMPYATYVERMNLDVLESAENQVKETLQRLMKKIKF